MTVARYYDESKNPDRAFLPGVPLRDVEDDEFADMPVWLQESVDASPLYRKTKPPSEAPKRASQPASAEKES